MTKKKIINLTFKSYMCLFCENKINKNEYYKIFDELWYNKDANLLIECTKYKYSYHKNLDKIIITNLKNILFKKNK